jgi:hypothetical protein
MKTWYMNLQAKQFRIIYTTLLILPILTSLAFSVLEIGKSFRSIYPAFMVIPLILIMVRRNTHPSEFPKMKWTSSMIIAAGILIIFYGVKIINRY